MKCTLCQSECADPVAVSSSRKLIGYAPIRGSLDLRYTDYELLEPLTTWLYNVHEARCLPMLRHMLGSHETTTDKDCDLCADGIALGELQALSEAAKGLICHRLRNPLAVVLGRAELALERATREPEPCLIRTSELEAIMEAGQRIDREINAMLGL